MLSISGSSPPPHRPPPCTPLTHARATRQHARDAPTHARDTQHASARGARRQTRRTNLRACPTNAHPGPPQRMAWPTLWLALLLALYPGPAAANTLTALSTTPASSCTCNVQAGVCDSTPPGSGSPPPVATGPPPETQGTVRSAVWCRILFAEKGIYKYMYICMGHREQWQLNPFNGRHFYGRACNPLQNIRLSAFLLFQERWLFFFLGRGVLGHKSNLWDKKMIALNHFNIFCLQNYAQKFLRREEEEILRKTFSFSGV